MSYIASDIYERMEADEEGLGGSVQEDLNEFDNMQDMEEYFGDLDPFLFL